MPPPVGAADVSHELGGPAPRLSWANDERLVERQRERVGLAIWARAFDEEGAWVEPGLRESDPFSSERRLVADVGAL